ncbi:hypothetical protein GW932_02930 [archaeon]|nr:hypothetical protein [archaeon]
MAGEAAQFSSSFSFDNLEEKELNPKSTDSNENSEGAESEDINDDNEKPIGKSLGDLLSSNENLQDSAIALLETDDFIMTDKGFIPKSSLSQDNSKSQNPKDDEKILGKFKSVDDLVKSYTELEKKLGSNSDAVNKLREVEPVLPMLEAMINDDGFLEMAERYFTNPEEQRKQLMKSLDIEDGYVFDLENALADPKSKDAKILEKISAQKADAQKRSQQTSQKDSKNQIPEEEKMAFISKHGIKDEEFDLMLEQAKSYKITLDDIYFLINKDKIIDNAKKEASKPYKQQAEAAQYIGKPKTNGASMPKKSEADVFMDFIKSGSSVGLFT